jgi:hypothetical protein
MTKGEDDVRTGEVLTLASQADSTCTHCRGSGYVWILCCDTGVIRDRCHCTAASDRYDEPALQYGSGVVLLITCFALALFLLVASFP